MSHCVVIGGGLAGLAAACSLLDSGFRVTLSERRSFLGGRAFSFIDPETGQHVDNGQHVFLGCCSAYIAFLERLGVTDRTVLQERPRITVADPAGRWGCLSGAPWLPAPLHLLPSFIRYPHLGPGEKLRVLVALGRIWATDGAKVRDSLERQSFLDWLRAHGQGPRAVERFWELLLLPLLNDRVASVSASSAFMAVRETLLGETRAAAVGYSRVGLTELISDAAGAYITARGGKLLLEQPAGRLEMRDGQVAAVATPGGPIEGDLFVTAVPWHALPRLLPEEWAADPFFAPPSRLEAAPIVGLHLWYDRPVMDEEFTAFLDSPVQWVFNKSRIQGLDGEGQYLCVSLSGAWEYVQKSREELRQLFRGEMERLYPRARDARLEGFVAVKQPDATFRVTPGADDHRLPQTTPIPNLFLAGDWTETGWPSTMESAVRSGLLAAQAARGASEMA